MALESRIPPLFPRTTKKPRNGQAVRSGALSAEGAGPAGGERWGWAAGGMPTEGERRASDLTTPRPLPTPPPPPGGPARRTPRRAPRATCAPASPTRIGALLAAAALASSCTQAGGLESATHHAPPSPSATAKEPYTVAVGGDVHFEGVLRERLEKDPSTAMGPIADVLSEADLALVNLETAVTGGGTPAPGKDFRFRAPDTAFEALDAAGVDVASLANNHGMDYGRDGLADTLDAADRA